MSFPCSFHPKCHYCSAGIPRARCNVYKQVARALECKVPGWVTLPDGTHLFKDRVYVPISRPLRNDIIRAHHDPALAGHPGEHKTTELILRDYWWPTIRADVKRYIGGC